MAIFEYKAVREPGSTVSGELEANDLRSASAALLARGFHVLEIHDIERKGRTGPRYRLGGWGGLKRRDLVRTARDMASLLRAGLPLSRALEKLHVRATNTRWKEIADGMRAKIADGQTLSQALSAYPEVFDPMFVNLVRSGEESGRLADVLQRLADLRESQEEIVSRVKMAMVYPGLMLTLGLVTVVVLVTFIVPTFVEVFQDTGQKLPLPTSVLVGISGFFSTYWWLILPGALVGGFALVRYLKSPPGRRAWGAISLRLPLLGGLAQRGEIAAFTRTLGTLLANGIHIVRAIEITSRTLNNPVYAQAVGEMAGPVREGESLSNTLEENPLFPDMVASVVAVGEESGSIDQSLNQIADEYEREVDREVKVVMTLLEPAMILFIGAIVGFIVMAMLLPIFELGESIQL
jgi:type II secretory pathway component PulF